MLTRKIKKKIINKKTKYFWKNLAFKKFLNIFKKNSCMNFKQFQNNFITK